MQQSLPLQWTFQVGYVANHGVHIGASQNINLPSALGLGAAGQPENIAFGAHSEHYRLFPGFLIQLSVSPIAVEPPLQRRFGRHYLIYLGKGSGLSNRRRWQSFVLDRSASQLCTQRLRSPAQLRGEPELRVAVRSWQAVVEFRHRIVVIGGWQLAAMVSLYWACPSMSPRTMAHSTFRRPGRRRWPIS